MIGLDRALEVGEDQTTEFKSTFAEQEKIVDSLVAFANARGGTVFVGITPKSPHRVIGAGIGANTLENFDARLRAKAGNLPGFESEIVPYDDVTVVRLSVAQHEPGQLLMSNGIAFIRGSRSNERG